MHGHGDGERLQRQRLALHGEIALGVAGGGADDADMDREGPIEQALLAVERDQLDQVLGRPGIDLAAAIARIDEGAEPDGGDMAGAMGGDVAEQMGDHALRQVIGLDLVVEGELLQLRHKPPMAADHALDEPLMGEVVEAAVFAVSLAGSVDEGQVFWRAGRAGRFSAGAGRARPLGALAPEKSLLERKGDLFGKSDADEAAGRNRVAVADEPHRLRGAHHFAFFRRPQIGEGGMNGHDVSSCFSIFSAAWPRMGDPCATVRL